MIYENSINPFDSNSSLYIHPDTQHPESGSVWVSENHLVLTQNYHSKATQKNELEHVFDISTFMFDLHMFLLSRQFFTNLRWFSRLFHFEYKKRLLLRCIHHFKSDLIKNMDHMRTSGTEPSSVILSQKSIFKSWKEMSQTCQNKLKPKGMV